MRPKYFLTENVQKDDHGTKLTLICVRKENILI